MGLDMYLTAERYFWFDEPKPQIPEIPQGFEPKTVTVEAAYWRKANQIHAWFVKHVQDGEDECRPHHVSREKLLDLKDTCQLVLADRSKAEELLPSQSGFFFGGTEYDEWYFGDLEQTVTQIDKVLGAFPEDKWSFEYRSSW